MTMNTMMMYRQKDPLNLNPNLVVEVATDLEANIVDVAREALNLNLAEEDAVIAIVVVVKDSILRTSEFSFVDFDFGKLITPEIFL